MKTFKFFSKNKRRTGIALLFTVMLSSILLVIALSMSNIATKEAIFSTSARNANDAFYAADTGAECALFSDSGTDSYFVDPISGNEPPCIGSSNLGHSTSNEWNFTISGIGSADVSCAKVTVTKTVDGEGITTTQIISEGYNKEVGGVCEGNTNNVERRLEVIYTN